MAAAKRKPSRERELRLVASHGTVLPGATRPLAPLVPTPPESHPSSVDAYEVNDVPAAVLCAQCGLSDCTGNCEEYTASGVFVLVPWERGDGAMLRRLFATSRAATLDAETFFERLSDGAIMPALGFAIAAEVVAALSLVVAVTVPLALAFPDVARECMFEPALRRQLVLALLLGVPGLAALLVVAHAVHGLSVDVGAKRQGARSARTRALRFGLYAAGWDLVMGPFGALVVSFTEGPRAALRIFTRGVGLPTVSTLAFLRNAYRLEGEPAKRALRASYWGAAIATVLVAMTILGAAFVALFV